FLTYLIIGVVFFGIFTVVSGPLAEKLGRRKMLLGVTVLIAAYGLIVNALFNAGTAGVIIALLVGFILLGLTFGPMAASPRGPGTLRHGRAVAGRRRHDLLLRPLHHRRGDPHARRPLLGQGHLGPRYGGPAQLSLRPGAS